MQYDTSIESHNSYNSVEASFFNLSIDLLCSFGLDGYFHHLNLAWESTLGFTKEELLAKPVIEWLHTEDTAVTLASIQQLVAGAETVSFENRFFCKDGSYKWFAWKTIPSPQSGLLYAVVRDITDRKQTEQAQLRLINHMHLLLESTGEGIYGIDLQGRCTFINQAAAQMIGYQPHEVMGEDMHQLIHHTHPNGSTYANSECPIFCSFRHGNSCRIDNEVLWRRDGTCFAAEYSSYPIIEGGTIQGAVVTFTDISDRKQAEAGLKQANEMLELRVEERTTALTKVIQQLEDEIADRHRVEAALRQSESRLNSIFNSLKDVVWSISASTSEVLFLNPATEKLYGRSAQEFFDQPHLWLEVMYPEDRDRAMQHMQKVRQEGNSEVEYRIIHRQGELRWVYSRSWLIHDENGVPIRIDGLSSDITERKQAEKAQARLTAILEATPDLVGTSDAQGKVLYMNQAGRKMLSLGEDEDLSQRHISEFSVPSATEIILAEGIPTAIQAGVWTGETTFQYRNSREIPVSQVIMSHKGENGEVEFFSTIARDITAAKQAQAAIRQSELSLAEAQRIAHIGSWEFDLTTQEITWSEELFRLWGMEPSQSAPTYEEFLQKISPDDLQAFVQAVNLAIAEGKPYELDIRTLQPDGSISHISSKGQPIVNSQGQVIKLCGTGLDITDRKQAEEQLRQTTSELKAIFQAFPDLYFRLSADGIILDYNAGQMGVENLYIPPEVFLNKSMLEVLPPQVGQQFHAAILQVLETNSLVVIEYSLPNQTEDKSYEARLVPLLENQMMVIIRDITQRKQAEEALRQSEAKFRQLAQREELLNRLANDIRNSLDVNTILEAAVVEIQSLLQIDRCNFTWYLQSAEKPVWEVVKEAKSPTLPSLLGQHSLQETFLKEKFFNKEIFRADDLRRNIDPACQEFYTAWGYTALLALPIQMSSGDIGMLSCAQHTGSRPWSEDEVELLQAVVDQLAIALSQAELYNQAQETAQLAQQQAQKIQQTLHQLQQAQAQLIQTEKMSSLGQLVAGIAHEINNPVNFIHGNLNPVAEYTQDLLALIHLYQEHYPTPLPAIQDQTEAIDLDFLVEDLPKILNSMKIGTDRIRQIVLSLRNFSRLDEAEMKQVNIHEGIDNTLLILQNRLKAKPEYFGIEIIKEYGNLPLVECYPGQLNQVFMNLINNAIDALEDQPEPRRITIRTEMGSGDALPTPYVRIRIADNGSGMTEEVKARLFDPFFTTKSVGKGTGLGLSISYQIVVEKHGGILKCISEPGQGAEFWIEIPIR